MVDHKNTTIDRTIFYSFKFQSPIIGFKLKEIVWTLKEKVIKFFISINEVNYFNKRNSCSRYAILI